MIRITVTFLSKDDERIGLEYKVDNQGGTEGENAGALAMLGLVNAFFDNPEQGGFLTDEQGEIVRKKVDEIIERFGQ